MWCGITDLVAGTYKIHTAGGPRVIGGVLIQELLHAKLDEMNDEDKANSNIMISTLCEELLNMTYDDFSSQHSGFVVELREHETLFIPAGYLICELSLAPLCITSVLCISHKWLGSTYETIFPEAGLRVWGLGFRV